MPLLNRLTRAINNFYSLEISHDPRKRGNNEHMKKIPQSTETKRQIETRSITSKLNTAILTLVPLLCVLAPTLSSQCPNGTALYWEDYTLCNEQAIEVWSLSNGNYCWLKDPQANK
uniref:Uncharacterized protein n=1 Tax=Acrobeloides nanus TaxID=290746 RepID=A0A914CHJ9_9BILA